MKQETENQSPVAEQQYKREFRLVARQLKDAVLPWATAALFLLGGYKVVDLGIQTGRDFDSQHEIVNGDYSKISMEERSMLALEETGSFLLGVAGMGVAAGIGAIKIMDVVLGNDFYDGEYDRHLGR